MYLMLSYTSIKKGSSLYSEAIPTESLAVKEDRAKQNAHRDANNNTERQLAAGSKIEPWELHRAAELLVNWSTV